MDWPIPAVAVAAQEGCDKTASARLAWPETPSTRGATSVARDGLRPGPRVPASPPKRLTRDRRRIVRERIVAIMRLVEPTPFAAEGPCRAGIRSSLCLQGWSWQAADDVAAEIVAAALNVVGAKRPTWYQGQPEWTQPGALPIERQRCIRCGKRLPEGHYKFCSKDCSNALHEERRASRSREERALAAHAYRAAWRARQPEQPCEGCGAMFQPGKKGQRYCRPACVSKYAPKGCRP